MQIQHAIEDFIVFLEANGRARRTVEVYAWRLQCLGGLPELELVTPRQVEGIIAGLRRSDIALATLAGYVQAVKSFFSWCCKRGLIRDNPAGGVHKVSLRGRQVVKAIRQVDLNRMIGLARQRGMILELAVILFLADTGCRAGELVNLNLCDVNLEGGEARTHGKTGTRMLDFTPVTAAALAAWLEIRPATDTDAFFTTREGRFHHARVYRALRDLARELGISRFNPHSIRHRVGQGWIDQGANLEIVRQKLGHADISTTAMIYGNLDRERIKAASQVYSLVK